MKRCALALFVYSISAFGMWTGEDSAQPPTANCSESERALFEDEDFAKFWSNCTSVFGLNVEKMSGSYPGISDSCMICMIEMTNCGIRHCKRKCAPWPIGHGSTSQQCKDCSRDHCGDTFDECAGISPIR